MIYNTSALLLYVNNTTTASLLLMTIWQQQWEQLCGEHQQMCRQLNRKFSTKSFRFKICINICIVNNGVVITAWYNNHVWTSHSVNATVVIINFMLTPVRQMLLQQVFVTRCCSDNMSHVASDIFVGKE